MSNITVPESSASWPYAFAMHITAAQYKIMSEYEPACLPIQMILFFTLHSSIYQCQINFKNQELWESWELSWYKLMTADKQ